MFEGYTFKYCLNKMLNNISNEYDKREGSVIYNAIAPCAMELSELYKNLDETLNQAFVTTATGEYLDNLSSQFGIERNAATKAIKKGIFYDSENHLMDVEIGKRFSINSINYETYIKISTGIYQMRCETAGEIGNSQSGAILPLDYVEGLGSAQLAETLIPGEDEETDEELRTRFFENVNSVAFGGNMADYKEKVKEIDGVGAVKVIPTWNGGGTVKLIILDSSLNTPSQTLIQNVQDTVGQNGNGIAPIGHTVTTVGATNINITIGASLTLDSTVTIDEIQESIEEAIQNYFNETKEGWENASTLIIRIAHIESRILDVTGVIDISNTTINGIAENLTLSNEQIPYLSEVVLSA